MNLNIWHLLLLGLAGRLALLFYGIWHDATMALKFTDVDYYVFHDAAEYVTQGQSPYLRATYRYSPLLALLLQPNIYWTVHFGKLLFILFDLLTGYLIFNILKFRQASQTLCLIATSFWLFNPLSGTVSVRGNAESMMSFLVLACVDSLIKRQTFIAGLVYAISVHFKIYPVTYALAVYLFLGENDYCYGNRVTDGGVSRLKKTVIFLLPNRDRLVFALSSVGTLAVLTAMFYHQYGWEFLYHTYLYHITRKDIRHNFSVYFYMLYLQTKGSDSAILGLLVFIPQVVLLVIFSVKFYKDIALVFFLNTFVFVTFNKVCTSQYFFWYLCLLPLLLDSLRLSKWRALFLVMLWFLGQGLWLLPAYYLEFEGMNTYFWIWLAGLLFFSVNIYVMYAVIESYQSLAWKHTDAKEPPEADNSLKRKTLNENRFQKYFQRKAKVS